MSIFSTIMEKIFHHPAARPAQQSTPLQTANAQPAVPQPATSQPATAQPDAPQPAAPPAPSQSAASPPPAQAIDVEAVLTEIAAQKDGGGNWRSSIVDLLKLLDLDSSLQARKALADELNVHVGANGSAEENVALHKAVMQKLAENGGKVPASLKA